ncbi:MAG: hypothetical protein AAGD38_00795 [Acidobacteriota bacterium]
MSNPSCGRSELDETRRQIGYGEGKRRQEMVPDAVAWSIEVVVGGVGDRLDAGGLESLRQGCARHRQEGA